MTFGNSSRRQFIRNAAAAACASAVPKLMLGSPLQDPVVDTVEKNGKFVSREKIPWKAKSFPMKNVRLGDGPCKGAMEADRRYLHSLPPDRVLHTFRINAGLPSSAQPLGGWEAPDCELRGHYAGGHYLSACALMYASTGDDELRANANTVIAELAKCQTALKNGGYLSAFPVEFFDRLRERERVWAPFYTIHKIMAGALDVYVYCGNEQALDVAQKMAGWVEGGSVTLNGTPLQAFSSPSSYLSLNRIWRSGDKIELNLPMNLHVDPMPDDATVQAMMYGPLSSCWEIRTGDQRAAVRTPDISSCRPVPG